ncbi:hypothetical protein GW891_01330 [bacterium]|nr:hypothetical protein [bacterium]
MSSLDIEISKFLSSHNFSLSISIISELVFNSVSQYTKTILSPFLDKLSTKSKSKFIFLLPIIVKFHENMFI